MKLSDMFVSVLVVSALVGGMGIAVSDLGANYGKTDQFDYSVFNQTTQVQSSSQDLVNKLNATSSQGFNPLQVFDVLNFLFFQVSPIIFALPNLIINIINMTSNATGGLIPGWLIGLAIVATLIVVAMKVLSIATRRSE